MQALKHAFELEADSKTKIRIDIEFYTTLLAAVAALAPQKPISRLSPNDQQAEASEAFITDEKAAGQFKTLLKTKHTCELLAYLNYGSARADKGYCFVPKSLPNLANNHI